MDFLKTVGGKIVSGLVAVAVVAIAISWFQMSPQTRQSLVHGTAQIIGWTLLVAVVPWVTFFVVAWISRRESNLAGAALVVVYTAIEAVTLAWLFAWGIHGATRVVLFAAATLLAGAYNLLTCDWIAEKTG